MKMGYSLLNLHIYPMYQVEAMIDKRLDLPSMVTALSGGAWHARVVSKNPILPTEQEYASCY
jgi:hypothetical protein